MSDPTLFDAEHLMVRRRCEVCGVALIIEHTHTYVVQRQVWIKIGATSRPRKRMNELARVDWKNYCLWPRGMDWTQPLIKHAMIERDIEHEMHSRFAEFHVIGEWFTDNLTIRRWIEEVRHEVPSP